VRLLKRIEEKHNLNLSLFRHSDPAVSYQSALLEVPTLDSDLPSTSSAFSSSSNLNHDDFLPSVKMLGELTVICHNHHVQV